MQSNIEPQLLRGRGRPRKYANNREAKEAAAKRKAERQAIHQRIKEADKASSQLPVTEILLVTVQQAAQALSVSTGTVVNMINQGVLNTVKIMNTRRIALDEIRRLVATGTGN